MKSIVIVLMVAVLTGCTTLGALNAVLTKDQNTGQVTTDLAYGSTPRHRLDIYVPKDPDLARDRDKWPVVMFLYGGSWKDGRRQDYEFVGRALNAHGYIAVIPDYRLVPEVHYPDFVLDGAMALRWVHDNIAEYGGDPEQLFLAGHSAGAYNAIMLTVATGLLKQHGLTVPPILGAAGLAGPYDFLPLQFEVTRNAFGEAQDLEATQPVNLVTPDIPPLLLLHGTDDDRVLVRNSRRLHQIGQQVNARTTLKEYPDTGHAGLLLSISKPLRDNTPVLRDMMRFFDDILAGRLLQRDRL